MRQHTEEFKQGLIELGREVSAIITYNNTTLTNDELYRVKPYFETELLKSIMTGLEIDSSVDIPKNTTINFKWGIKVGDEYEYIDYGNFIVYSSERQEDKNTYNIVAYDGMLKSMKEYEGLSIDFPCTIQNYVTALADSLGYDYTPTEFTNYNNLIQDVWITIDNNNNKKSLGYTYRDVLDDIAEATACNIIIKNNELLMITPNETNENIPEDFIKTTSTEFATFGPINAVVLSRSSSDNIYARDTESIEENGLFEIKISDNQILNGNDRNTYIEGIYNALRGITIITCDFSTCGIGYLEPLDKYSVTIGNTTYNNLVLFNSDLTISDGIIENIYTEEPSQSETDYKKADTTDIRQNQTTLIVDKQAQQIQGLITNTNDNTERISSLTQTVGGFDARITEATIKSNNATNQVAQLSMDVSSLRSEIGEVTDTTVREEGYGRLEFTSINQSYPVKVNIHAMSDKDIECIHPRSNLFPSSTLYPQNRILRFLNNSTNEVFDYILPNNLRYYSANVYDEFRMDFATGGDTSVCEVQKKVGINADGSKYALTTETTTQYAFPTQELALTDGDYVVEVLGYPNAYLDITLMSKNMYTSQFATKVEMHSSITQKADEITTQVSRTYYTKGEGNTLSTKLSQTATDLTAEISDRENGDTKLSNRITANANSITAEITNRQNADRTLTSQLQVTDRNIATIVSEVYTNGINSQSRIDQNANKIELKVDNSNYTHATIVAKINDNTSTAMIRADRVNITANNVLTILAGNTINMTTRNIAIRSDNFSVTKDGVITAKSGNIAGWEISQNNIYKSGKASMASGGHWAFMAGASDFENLNSSAKFKVGFSGKLYCSSAEISGTITGSTITGTTINGGTIKGSTITGTNITGGTIRGNTIISNDGGFNMNTNGYMTLRDSGTHASSRIDAISGDGRISSSFSSFGVYTKSGNYSGYLEPGILRVLGGSYGIICTADELDYNCSIEVYDDNTETYIYPEGIVANGTTYNSRESIKKNITLYDKTALNFIKNSQIYEYHYKYEKDSDKKHIGFVIGDEGGNYKTPDEVISPDKKGIDQYNMISVLWKAVQELNEKIEAGVNNE